MKSFYNIKLLLHAGQIFSRPYLSNGRAVVMVVVRPSVRL